MITSANNDEIISDDENIHKTLNNFFSNLVKNLNLKVDKSLLNQNLDFIEDLVLKTIKRYQNHPSIKRTERNVERRNLSFSFATFTDMDQQLKNLNLEKFSQDTDIPTRLLKESSDLFAQFNYINLS